MRAEDAWSEAAEKWREASESWRRTADGWRDVERLCRRGAWFLVALGVLYVGFFVTAYLVR